MTCRARVSTVQRFLGSRVVWTAYLRELSASLPDNVYLTSLRGDAELANPKKTQAAKRSLVIKGAFALPENGLIPPEVDQLVDKLRRHPLLTQDFPVVEMADLKRFHRVGDDRDVAMFTVVCLPKGRPVDKKKDGEQHGE